MDEILDFSETICKSKKHIYQQPSDAENAAIQRLLILLKQYDEGSLSIDDKLALLKQELCFLLQL